MKRTLNLQRYHSKVRKQILTQDSPIMYLDQTEKVMRELKINKITKYQIKNPNKIKK